MYKCTLSKSFSKSHCDSFIITGSKSISHRALIINYLLNDYSNIQNISNSQDTSLLSLALKSNKDIVDVKYSGTALRFLISLFSLINRSVTLIGAPYLFSRPIKSLIEVLNILGADIKLLNNKVIINKSHLEGGVIKLQAHHTSQFVSSLLLIAPYLNNGLTIHLDKTIVSKPYIDMTLYMINQCGGNAIWQGDSINIKQISYNNPYRIIESDWTSVSYLYLSFLFSNLTKISISTFIINSIQGDSSLIHFFSILGIETEFHKSIIVLNKSNLLNRPKTITWDFKSNPDLFQTFIIACLGLGIKLIATGLNTLYFKETNRVISMKIELAKFNCNLDINTENKAFLLPSKLGINKIICINTYDDHRMALAFAPLSLLNYNIEIDNMHVVNKSYPTFWTDLIKFGVSLT